MAKKVLDLAAEIILENLTLDHLREGWRRLHQTPPPKRLSRDILMRGITYKMQQNAFGGLSKAAFRKLQTSAPTDALAARSADHDRRSSRGHVSCANGMG